MEPNETWTKILKQIKDQISAANFRTWFSQTTFGSITEEKLTINVPSAFIKNQLTARYDSLIHLAIEQTTGNKLIIEYVVDPSLMQKKNSSDSEVDFAFTPFNAPITQPTGGLNPRYTLDNFVVGLTNNLAYAASQAVVSNPGTSYNPLFIYGPSGVGKTHLMQAIGNALIKKDPYLKLIFASSEKFMNDFIDSLQFKKTGEFRQRYRNCHILLIDDIQFISGKDSTQEEFFHTFNELQSKNAQVVLTSDRPPGDIQKLEPRLQSRFQGGLMVDIQIPDFDTRVAILRAKLLDRGEKLPEEVVSMIAESAATSTRELEGRLTQVVQMTKLTNQEPNVEVISKFLGKPQATRPNTPLDYKKVLNEINQYFNVKLSDLTGPRRQKGFVLPRQIAMYLMYEDCKIPMERIGEILGGRDHTTVLHGIEKIKAVSGHDTELQRLIGDLRHQLAG